MKIILIFLINNNKNIFFICFFVMIRFWVFEVVKNRRIYGSGCGSDSGKLLDLIV